MKIIDKIRIRDTKNISNYGHKLTKFKHLVIYDVTDKLLRILAQCKVCHGGIMITFNTRYKTINRTGNLIGSHLICNCEK
jgi:hypothetical protein